MLPNFLTKRKIAFLVLIIFSLSFLATKSVRAFSTPNDSYQLDFEKAVYQTPEMNLQSFVYETLKATAGSVVTTITGCLSCPAGQRTGGAMGTVTNIIGALYTNPPASGVQYLADMGQKLSIVQPVYAQRGLGYEKMKVFQNVWKAFRDVAYAFLVLIFIIIGFMIMFRVKISPQAVITIQSAIPKLVIVLILITFSYAIVGFLIDLMFVFTNLIMFVFRNSLGGFQGLIPINVLPNNVITTDVQLLNTTLWAGSPAIIAPLLILMLVPTALSFLAGPIGGAAVIVDFLILIIFALVFFIALIRILWMLLKAYITVVLNLIFAPFIILIGALPGSDAISGWFRNLIANLAIFPVVFLLTLLAGYLTLTTINDIIPGFVANFWQWDWNAIRDALLNAPTQIASGIILVFVSAGILLLTPKVGDIIQSFIQKRPFSYGTAIGEALGPIRAGGVATFTYIDQPGRAPVLQAIGKAGKYVLTGRP